MSSEIIKKCCVCYDEYKCDPHLDFICSVCVDGKMCYECLKEFIDTKCTDYDEDTKCEDFIKDNSIIKCPLCSTENQLTFETFVYHCPLVFTYSYMEQNEDLCLKILELYPRIIYIQGCITSLKINIKKSHNFMYYITKYKMNKVKDAIYKIDPNYLYTLYSKEISSYVNAMNKIKKMRSVIYNMQAEQYKVFSSIDTDTLEIKTALC